MLKTSEVLARARDVVANGWCKHQSMDKFGNHCALGAIADVVLRQTAATGPGPCRWGDCPGAALVAKAQELGYRDAVALNDDPTTTKQDVLGLVR